MIRTTNINNKITTFVLSLTLLVVFVGVSYVSAQSNFNEQINYQGKLTDATGATVADGTYNIAFNLYTSPTGGSPVWSSTTTVPVVSGLFSYMLGSSTSLAGVDFNQTLYLAVEIGATGTPAWDGQMSPRKILGAVPAAFEARQLGGASSTQYLRSDVANSATALLSFLGGASTTDLVVSGTTTMTTLDIGGEQYTTISGGAGSGLTNVGGVLTANISESNLNIAGSPTDDYILVASSTAVGGFAWVATTTVGGHDAVTLAGTPDYLTLSGQQITLNQLDLVDDLNTFSSANLANRLTDEVGSTGGGFAVFNAAPSFTGTSTFSALVATASSTINNLNFSVATGSTLVLGGDTITACPGTGLSVVGGSLTVGSLATATLDIAGTYGANQVLQASTTASGGFAWGTINPDSVQAGGQVDEYCLTYETGDTWEWQDCSASAYNLADLGDVNTTNVQPGGLLTYTGAFWATTSTSSLNINTDDLVEGANLFYTDARVATYISGSTTLLKNNTEAGLESFLTDVSNVFTNNDTEVSLLGQKIDLGTEVIGTLDISSTTLGITATGLEFSGSNIALTSGYNIPLNASTTNWNTFYNTPSTRITAGSNLSWSSNTLNATYAGQAGGWSVFDGTNVAISNSAAETTIFSQSVPANTLNGDGQEINFTSVGTYTNNTGGNANFTLRFKVGGTNVYVDASGNIATSATTRPVTVTGKIIRMSPTQAKIIADVKVANAGAVTTGSGDFGATSLRTIGTISTDASWTWSATTTFASSIQLSSSAATHSYTHDFISMNVNGEVDSTSLFTDAGAYTYLTAADDEFSIGTSTFGNAKLTVQSEGTSDILNLFETGGQEVFTVLENGNVGIGIASDPTTKLRVASDGSIVSSFTTSANNAYISFSDGQTTSNTHVRIGAEDNDLALWAGNNERLRIDSSGNVGIGTTTPSSLLHVYRGASGATPDATADDLVIENAGAAGISILARDNDESRVVFGSASDATGASLVWDHDTDLFTIGTTNTGGDLRFTVDSANEAMRILDSGNVGIGTSSPSSKLTVAGNTFVGGALRATGTVRFDSLTGGLLTTDANGNLSTTTVSAGDIALTQGYVLRGGASNLAEATSSLFIANTGNVGIGTSSPASTLDVWANSDDGNFAQIITHNGAVSGGHGLLVQSSNGAAGAYLLDLVGDYDGTPNYAMRVLANGNVGIGTTSPTSRLDVAGGNISLNGGWISNDGDNEGVYVDSIGRVAVGTSDTTNAKFTVLSSGAVRSRIESQTSSSILEFVTAAEEFNIGLDNDDSDKFKIHDGAGFGSGNTRLTIDAAGNVGIGTTSPRALLTVGSSTSAGLAAGELYNSAYIAGSLEVDGALYDNSNSAGVNGYVLQSTGTGFNWVATSSLGIGGSSLFTDGGDTTYLTSLTDSLAIGSTTAHSGTKLDVWGNFRVGTSSSPALFVDTATGQTRFGSGSVSAPSMTFAGDTDSGFYRITSDRLGLALAGTNILDVRAAGFEVNNVSRIDLGAGTSIGSGFGADTPPTNGLIVQGNTGIGTSTDLTARLSIQTSGTDDILNLFETGGQEVFTVLESGNVGVGSTSPSDQLVLQRSSGATGGLTINNIAGGARFQMLANPGSSNDIGFGFSGDESDGRIRYNNATQAMSFNTNNLTRLTINSSGNVGIGTTSPASKLDVWGDFRVGTSSTPTLLTDVSGGRVSIGTTTMSQKLFIQSSAGGDGIGLINTNSAAGGNGITIYDDTTFSKFQIGYNNSIDAGYLWLPSADPLRFGVNNAEQMRIDDTGNVGIGSTSPSSKLTVAGNTYLGGNVTATGTLTFGGETFSSLTGAGVSASGTLLELDINELATSAAFGSGDFLAFYDTGTGQVRKVDYDNLPGAGGGLTSLNGQTGASQSFATSSDTNITLSIVSAGDTHTFTPGWTGTLAGTRGGTGLGTVTENELLIGGAGNTWTQIGTSSLGLGDGTLGGLLDVDTTNVLSGNLLSYNGSSWATTSTSSLNILSFGSDNQIPFMNATGDDFEYNSNFVFNGTNLSIGTTNIDRILNIAGANNPGARFTDTTNSVALDMRAEDFQGFIGTFSNHDLRFVTNNSSRMTIDTNGDVGIGTTSPASRLDVWGDFRVGTSSEPTLFADVSTNRVGVGVSNPQSLLHVKTTSGDGIIRLEGAGGAFTTFEQADSTDFRISRTGTGGYDFLIQPDGDVILGLQGNVGIGTSSPRALLTVGSSTSAGLTAGELYNSAYIAGSLEVDGALYDNSDSAGVSGYVLQSTGSGFNWVATSSLGFGGSSLFTDSGAITYLTSLTDSLAIGSTTADSAKLYVEETITTSGTGFDANTSLYTYVNPSAAQTGLHANDGLNSIVDYQTGATNAARTLRGVSGQAYYSSNSGSVQNLTALHGFADIFDAGTVTNLRGLDIFAEADAGTVTTLYGGDIGTGVYGATVGTVYGLYVDNAIAGGSITGNRYGLYLTSSGSIGGTDYGVYQATAATPNYFAGNVGIGTTSPASKLDVWGDFRVGTSSIPLFFADVSAGRVGIATSTLTHELTVEGSISVNGLDGFTYNDDYPKVRYWATDANLPAFEVDENDGLRYNQTENEFDFVVGGSDVLQINASTLRFEGTGDSYVAGSLGVGTTTTLTRQLTVADDVSIRGISPVLYLDDTDYGGGRPGVRFTNNDLMTFAGDDSGTDTQYNFYSVFSDTRTTDASLRVFGDAAGDWGNYISMGHSGANGYGAIATDVGEIRIDPGGTYGIDLIGTTTITAASPGESVGDQGMLNFNPSGGFGADVRSRLISSEDRAFIDYYTESGGTGSWIFGNQFGTQKDILKIDGSSGNVGIGTTTPAALLSMDDSAIDGTATAGIDQYFSFGNTVASAIQYGNKMYYDASANTATTTMVGGIIRLEDGTTFGNTVRGFEVQVNKGSNTQGENTALSGFARTFGVRGYSSGDAGGTYEPAGGYFETGGTSQGNAIRGYSSTITTSDLLSLYQDTSDFIGTGLLMNFGNGGGSFPATSTTAKFVDFQNAGTSKFTVSAHGTTTIGDGTTNYQAGLQIGYGGLCVDNDGTCTASTTGRISSVSSYTGNSDLAEMYFSSERLEPGELVVADEFISVKRATGENGQVLGVISTKPGFVLGSDDTPLQPGKAYPLALSGRVPVKLSTESGPIAVGDPLTLSSLPGVAMKADSTTEIVGYALEAFDGTYAYTDGFVNQFGDDIAEPNYEATNVNTEALLDGSCYFGGGGEAGATTTPDCDPVDLDALADAEEAAADEAARRHEAEMAALEALRNRAAATEYVDGEPVRVGTVTMFVDRGMHFAAKDMLVLEELTSTSTDLVLGADEDSGETLWSRLKLLAQSFVDGVLAIAGIETEHVQTSELCVDDVCVTADDLRALLEGGTVSSSEGDDAPVVNDSDVENPGENESPSDSNSGDNNETGTSTESIATTPPTDLAQGTSTDGDTVATGDVTDTTTTASSTDASETAGNEANSEATATEGGGLAGDAGIADTTEDEPETDSSEAAVVVPGPEPVEPTDEPVSSTTGSAEPAPTT